MSSGVDTKDSNFEKIALSRTRTRHIAFVMELQAGMGTHYLNWRRIVEQDPTIEATWAPISYYQKGGWIEQLKFLPREVRAVWRCVRQVEAGLGRRRYDSVLFSTHNPAVAYPPAVRTQRAFLMFDVTPRQYDGMATWYEHVPDGNTWLAKFKHNRVRDTFQSAAGLMAWSHWAAQSAIEDYGVDPKRVNIVPSGVDTSLWKPADEDTRTEDGIVRILFTGYMFERKGGDLLLRWAKETGRKNWEMHIVTKEPMATPPGVVLHTGMGSNSPELIHLAQQCDLFALPTRADCFSIASLEAMAVGMPVITTTVGGIPDIIQDGENGPMV